MQMGGTNVFFFFLPLLAARLERGMFPLSVLIFFQSEQFFFPPCVAILST